MSSNYLNGDIKITIQNFRRTMDQARLKLVFFFYKINLKLTRQLLIELLLQLQCLPSANKSHSLISSGFKLTSPAGKRQGLSDIAVMLGIYSFSLGASAKSWHPGCQSSSRFRPAIPLTFCNKYQAGDVLVLGISRGK